MRWRALADPLDGMTLTARAAQLARLARLATPDAEWERAAQEYAVENEDAAAAAGKPKGAAVDLDEEILAAIMPKIDPVAFYGPLGPIVDAATAHSEATKTGVAMQIIAQVGTMLRPFYIDLGDEKLPLNPFLIQCAPSAIGRKGTSAKFADTIIAPGIAAHAERVAFQIQLAEQDAARVAAAKAAAERAVADAEAQIDWAMTVTEEAKVAAEEKRDQAQADLDATRTRLNIWRKKLADTSLAPATLEIYMRSVTSAEGEEADLKAAVARAEADVARTAAALADRPAAIAAANEARRQALAALAGVKGSAAVNVQPWQRLYAELAKPPVILSGISSGEGVIFNIRDAREGREGKDDDPGVEQKRMLITLAEFGSVLALVRRPGSTLSSVIRNAYDCTPLETAAKVEPVRCAAAVHHALGRDHAGRAVRDAVRRHATPQPRPTTASETGPSTSTPSVRSWSRIRSPRPAPTGWRRRSRRTSTPSTALCSRRSPFWAQRSLSRPRRPRSTSRRSTRS